MDILLTYGGIITILCVIAVVTSIIFGIKYLALKKQVLKIAGGEDVAVAGMVSAGKNNENTLVESIKKALVDKEFKLYLQFIVDNKTKEIISAEALSRWHHSNGKVLTPGSYIESMEEASLIDTHDYYMFDRVCNQLHDWHNTEYGGITMSCNFTRITLSESDFAEKIKQIADKYEFERSKLIIEITEDTIEKNKDVAIKNIMLCQDMGFRFALDDMGSGYTSLINLCDYPIDVVKIDRDILLKTCEKRGKDLFLGMVALSHNLGLKVVCEGVETEEQNDFATQSDCDYIQGFYYSRVHFSEEAGKFLKDYKYGIISA